MTSRPTNQTARGRVALLLGIAWLCLATAPLSNAQSLMPLRVALCFEDTIKELSMAELDDTGAPSGYLPELAGALAQHLGRPLRIVTYSRAELYTSLERGEADLVMYPGVPPAGLKPHLALSRPWARSYQGVLTGRPNPEVPAFAPVFPESPDDVEGHRRYELVLAADNPWAAVIAKEYPSYKKRRVATLEEGYKLILKPHSPKNTAPRPALVLPLRQAITLQLPVYDYISHLGYLPKTAEHWQFALSPAMAQDSMDAVDQFILEYAKRPDGFAALNQKHLAWELKALERLGLPAYTDVAGTLGEDR